MELLVTAVAVLTAVILLDIALTAGIMIRLRAVQQHGSVPAQARDVPRPGTVVGEFTAADRDGRPVTVDDLNGSVLACFFAPGCPACERLAAELVANPPDVPVLAFVVSDVEQQSRQLVERLSALGRVCSVEEGDPVLAAFGVAAVPTAVRLWSGVVVAAGRSDQLSEPGTRREILGAISAGRSA